MNPKCRELQERLAEDGAGALREDAAAQRHLEECAECFAVLEGLARLDQALGAMPALDAPDAVVERVIAETSFPSSSDAPPFQALNAVARVPVRRRPVFWAIATAAVVIVASALTLRPLLREPALEPRFDSYSGSSHLDVYTVPDQGVQYKKVPPATQVPRPEANKPVELTDEQRENLRSLGYLSPTDGSDVASSRDRFQGKVKQEEEDKKRLEAKTYAFTDGERQNAPEFAQAKPDQDKGRLANEKQTGQKAGSRAEIVAGKNSSADDHYKEKDQDAAMTARVAPKVDDRRGKLARLDAPVRVGGALPPPRLLSGTQPVFPEKLVGAPVETVVTLDVTLDVHGAVYEAKVLAGHPVLAAEAVKAVKGWRYAPTLVNGVPVPVTMTITVTFQDGRGTRAPITPAPLSDGRLSSPASAFLFERERITGLAFQEPAGYWASTYQPGDPALKLLQASLRGWDRTAIGASLLLHDASQPVAQPFDAPEQAALGVFVHADARATEGPRRMLVQVGLVGSPRRGGPRPPTRLVVVLDLGGEIGTDAAADMRAVALAFAEQRKVGDRFSLVVAGRPGGVAVGADAFTRGAVTVALDRILDEQDSDAVEAAGLSRPEALAAAYHAVCESATADTALGPSAVVLVTAHGSADDEDALLDLAGQGAAAGVPLSVVGVGAEAPRGSLEEGALDRLASVGQGTRRALEARSDAARIAEAELVAASDVTARAVRLRVRLAPGVRLVDVLGSRRLDEAQAEVVRRTERAIDLRLSAQLGLEMDRGLDEDGIQMVLPAFHAGDTHVLLLDVVVPGAGPVADVTARYKDVTFLRNAVARASLGLERGDTPAGPLERNVLVNLLAWQLTRTLSTAAVLLDRGDLDRARTVLVEAQALRADLMVRVPGLGVDASLRRDLGLLRDYAQALGSAGAASERTRLADSLRLAARLKQHSA